MHINKAIIFGAREFDKHKTSHHNHNHEKARVSVPIPHHSKPVSFHTNHSPPQHYYHHGSHKSASPPNHVKVPIKKDPHPSANLQNFHHPNFNHQPVLKSPPLKTTQVTNPTHRSNLSKVNSELLKAGKQLGGEQGKRFARDLVSLSNNKNVSEAIRSAPEFAQLVEDMNRISIINETEEAHNPQLPPIYEKAMLISQHAWPESTSEAPFFEKSENSTESAASTGSQTSTSRSGHATRVKRSFSRTSKISKKSFLHSSSPLVAKVKFARGINQLKRFRLESSISLSSVVRPGQRYPYIFSKDIRKVNLRTNGASFVSLSFLLNQEEKLLRESRDIAEYDFQEPAPARKKFDFLKKASPSPLDQPPSPTPVNSIKEIISPQEIISNSPKEIISNSPKEIISNSPKEIISSSPKEIISSSPKEIISSSLKEISNSPKEIIPSSPKEIISNSPKEIIPSSLKEIISSSLKDEEIDSNPKEITNSKEANSSSPREIDSEPHDSTPKEAASSPPKEAISSPPKEINSRPQEITQYHQEISSSLPKEIASNPISSNGFDHSDVTLEQRTVENTTKAESTTRLSLDYHSSSCADEFEDSFSLSEESEPQSQPSSGFKGSLMSVVSPFLVLMSAAYESVNKWVPNLIRSMFKLFYSRLQSFFQKPGSQNRRSSTFFLPKKIYKSQTDFLVKEFSKFTTVEAPKPFALKFNIPTATQFGPLQLESTSLWQEDLPEILLDESPRAREDEAAVQEESLPKYKFPKWRKRELRKFKKEDYAQFRKGESPRFKEEFRKFKDEYLKFKNGEAPRFKEDLPSLQIHTSKGDHSPDYGLNGRAVAGVNVFFHPSIRI